MRCSPSTTGYRQSMCLNAHAPAVGCSSGAGPFRGFRAGQVQPGFKLMHAAVPRKIGAECISLGKLLLDVHQLGHGQPDHGREGRHRAPPRGFDKRRDRGSASKHPRIQNRDSGLGSEVEHGAGTSWPSGGRYCIYSSAPSCPNRLDTSGGAAGPRVKISMTITSIRQSGSGSGPTPPRAPPSNASMFA